MMLPFFIFFATIQGNASPLVGDYAGATLLDGQIVPQPKNLLDLDISLKSDGTFQWHMIDHLMIQIEERASGTYTLKGGHLHLKGKATGFSDDGYKRETTPPDFDQDLTVSGKQLIFGTLIFARVGAKPTAPVGLGPLPMIRNAEAIQFPRQTEKTYHHLKSYSDTGVVLEKKHNYALQTSRLSTFFVAPRAMRFSIQIVESGKPVASAELWTKGKSIRHFDSLQDYADALTEEKSSEVLFEIGQEYGSESEVVPNLLTGEGFPLDTALQIVPVGMEEVHGVKCRMVRTDYSRDFSLTYWIDLARHLIVKVMNRDIAGSEEIELRPKANPSASPKELAPTEPMKRVGP